MRRNGRRRAWAEHPNQAMVMPAKAEQLPTTTAREQRTKRATATRLSSNAPRTPRAKSTRSRAGRAHTSDPQRTKGAPPKRPKSATPKQKQITRATNAKPMNNPKDSGSNIPERPRLQAATAQHQTTTLSDGDVRTRPSTAETEQERHIMTTRTQQDDWACANTTCGEARDGTLCNA